MMKRAYPPLGKLNMDQRKMSEEKQAKKNQSEYGNISIHVHEGIEYSVIKINSILFPLRFIATAVYSSIDTAYFIVDWRDGYFEIKIFGDDLDLNNLLSFSKEFQNKLTNHAFYDLQSLITAPLKNLVLDASNFPYDYTKEKLVPAKLSELGDSNQTCGEDSQDCEDKIEESIKSELDDIDLSDI